MSCSAGIPLRRSLVIKFVHKQREGKDTKKENRKTSKNVHVDYRVYRKEKFLLLP
jgi:hypothetical protein